MNSPAKLPVSVCLIAGNEVLRLGRTLQSVAGWAAEIIVVINHDVNDGTDKIAESFGAKVFREPWKGHIAQKNSAAQKAGQHWLLGVDADEVVSPELQEEIQRLFAGPEKFRGFNAFRFPRCTFYCGGWIRHGDWYPDHQIRLWRRGTARWGGVDPHDKLLVSGSVGSLRGDLLHYSMESIEHQIQKTIRYADEFAATCRAENRRITFWQLLIRPPWRFVRAYIFKLGFLDGWRGLSVAWMTAFYTFLRYFKAIEAQNRKLPS
jgi:glycosyltransferase involved in cell wall biosynthesis